MPMTLRQLVAAGNARMAHDWDMAALVVSAWSEVDFKKNPFRRIAHNRKNTGSFDEAAVMRMHNHLVKQKSQKELE